MRGKDSASPDQAASDCDAPPAALSAVPPVTAFEYHPMRVLMSVLLIAAALTRMTTSSALAFVPRADFATYCASKAFLHSWLVSLRYQLRTLPVEVLELSPPYVQTELTGAAQAADPRAMPLDSYISEVMAMLERGNHPRGELLLERDQARRWAERDGTYDSIFAAMNPVKANETTWRASTGYDASPPVQQQ